MKLAFEEIFAPFATAAVARLQYLYPDCTFEVVGMSIVIEGETELNRKAITRDGRFQLYREKIYHEGLPMRTLMYQTLLS